MDTIALRRALEQYADLKRERQMWAGKLKKAEEKKEDICTDSVSGSDDDFPYTKHTIRICGIEHETAEQKHRRKERYIRKFENAIIDCEDKEHEIYDYIMSVEDSVIRQILVYRYIDGLSLEKIGQMVYMDRTTVSDRAQRYLGFKI